MLGELISRVLVMVFGYVYPAFECYKVVESNRVSIQELRFWCQYWILVAILSVLERVGDTFVSWLPMYGELKLALFIYLWYPNTKGTDYVYDALLRPYVVKHEIDIDKKLLEWRGRAWDLALFYWKNCTDLGQGAFFQVLHYLASQHSSRSAQNNASPQTGGGEQQMNGQSSPTANRMVSETVAKSKTVKTKAPDESTEYVHIDALASILADSTTSPETPTNNNNVAQKLNQARQRLRRFTPTG